MVFFKFFLVFFYFFLFFFTKCEICCAKKFSNIHTTSHQQGLYSFNAIQRIKSERRTSSNGEARQHVLTHHHCTMTVRAGRQYGHTRFRTFVRRSLRSQHTVCMCTFKTHLGFPSLFIFTSHRVCVYTRCEIQFGNFSRLVLRSFRFIAVRRICARCLLYRRRIARCERSHRQHIHMEMKTIQFILN